MTPKTESGRALLRYSQGLPDTFITPTWLTAILAIEQEAASAAVAEVLDRLDDLVRLHRVLAVDQVRALIASERKP